jgi:hypothetical protein
MDPYLEDPALWPGVHDSLIIYTRDALQPLLLPRYYIEPGERIYFEDPREVIYPDAVVHQRLPPAEDTGGAATLVADEAIVLELELRRRETFLEIRSAGAHEVVTVLEIISPANKYGAGRGREEYRRNQDQVLGSNTSLVEIDLLRRGPSIVLAPPGELLTLPRFDYLACVSRAADRRRVETYPVSLRRRLPRISIPLRPPDRDVVMDLPAIFDRCYDNGAYLARIDYNLSPAEPFRPEDAAWADGLLREAGLRGRDESSEGPE